MDDNATEPAVNAKSILLTKLSLEIRRSIYRYAFAGSQLIFCPHLRRSTDEPVRKGQADAFFHTDHCKLLVVCRQIYNEAQAVFVEETLLCSDPYLYQSPEYLSTTTSDFTKAHTRHLRNIRAVTSLDDNYSFEPDRENLFRALSQFPKLTTCQLWADSKKLCSGAFNQLNTDTLPSMIDTNFGPTVQLLEAKRLSEFTTRVTFLFCITISCGLMFSPVTGGLVKVNPTYPT